LLHLKTMKVTGKPTIENKMKRQREFDENELIKLVKTRPVIYDRKSKDYRRPGITENAWLYIAEKLGVSKG
jgi:hypothetical protein